MNKIIEMHGMSTGISGIAGAGGLTPWDELVKENQLNYNKTQSASYMPQFQKAYGSDAGFIKSSDGSYRIGEFDDVSGTSDTFIDQADFGTDLGVQEHMAGMDFQSPDSSSLLTSDGMGFDSMKGKGGLALGGLNFGLGLMSFLDQKKTAGLQRDLMSQQLASNAETMANKRADRAHIKSVFGGGTATSGLKAV